MEAFPCSICLSAGVPNVCVVENLSLIFWDNDYLCEMLDEREWGLCPVSRCAPNIPVFHCMWCVLPGPFSSQKAKQGLGLGTGVSLIPRPLPPLAMLIIRSTIVPIPCSLFHFCPSLARLPHYVYLWFKNRTKLFLKRGSDGFGIRFSFVPRPHLAAGYCKEQMLICMILHEVY